MAMINRVLNVLVFALAVVALVFGYMLFDKRQQLRNHSDSLAMGLESVADNLAAEDLGEEMNYDDGEGPLGFNNVDQIAGLTKRLADRAAAVTEQRDDLGAALASVANDLNLVEEELAPESLVNLDSYEDSVATIQENVAGANARNQAIADGLLELGGELNVNVAASDLASTDPEVYGSALTKLSDAAARVNERNDEYLAALGLVLEKLGAREGMSNVTIDRFKNPNTLQQAVADLGTSLVAINEDLDEYETLAEEKDAVQAQRDDFENRLTVARESVSRMAPEIADLEGQVASLEAELDRLRKEGPGIETRDPLESTDVLHGEVVDVNYDWGYVVINIGQNDNLVENIPMTVGRDQEYIASVLVTKVYPQYAVAEINPEMQQGMVLEGDRVYWLNEEAALRGSTPAPSARPSRESATPATPVTPTEGSDDMGMETDTTDDEPVDDDNVVVPEDAWDFGN